MKRFWNHYFKVQIIETEFVLWGYGARGNWNGSGCHVAVAVTKIKLPKDLVVEFPYELPEYREGQVLPKAQEYERVKAWGWRIFSESGAAPGNWRLTTSRKECEEQAHEYFSERRLIFTWLEILDGQGEHHVEPGDETWESSNTEVLGLLEKQYRSDIGQQ